ncbi:MAG: hypothetical protein ACM3U2_06385, partial [Deltaproteobacteria bacterium]
SFYPPPRAPKRKLALVPKPKSVSDAPATAETDAGAGLPPKVLKTAPATPAVEAPASVGAATVPVTRRSVRQIVGEGRLTLTLKLDRWRRTVFSPVKLVLASVAGVVALTGWWILHVRERDEAERVVVAAARLGDEALKERDLGEAARQYRKVRVALDLLGRSDPQARALRQTAAETSAASELCSASLFEILHEAADAAARKTALKWEETFNSSYRDEWVVLDAQVSRTVDPASGPRYVIDYPLTEGENRGVIVADLDVFDEALSAGGGPQRVVFAAQLDDCRRDPKHGDSWLILLRPKTGFLWSSGENLALLGFGVDEATTQVLSEQSRHLGISR